MNLVIYMSKILLISNNGIGFYNFKKELVEKLLSMEYEVHFAVPAYEKIDELILKGACYHELNIDRRGMNPIKDIGLLLQLLHLINKVKPDIIVSHTIKPNIYGSFIASIKGIPYINNITGLGSALQYNNIMSKLLIGMYRISLSKSSAIFFENSENRSFFEQRKIGNKTKYVLVPGAGVNMEFYLPAHGSNPNKGITFLLIARVMKEKGIEEFISASETIQLRYPNTVFQILGFFDDDYYKEQINLLSERGLIEYLGVSKDTRVQMSRADCIVLPSYHEGMSNVLLEGAAMELPLITTDIPGCREAVDEGKNGFLCKKSDANSLIQAMEKFIALTPEERLQMGRCGREKMKREFDREIVVDRYVQCIQSAIKEH